MRYSKNHTHYTLVLDEEEMRLLKSIMAGHEEELESWEDDRMALDEDQQLEGEFAGKILRIK